MLQERLHSRFLVCALILFSCSVASTLASCVLSSLLIRPSLRDLAEVQVMADPESGGEARQFVSYRAVGVRCLLVHHRDEPASRDSSAFWTYENPIRLYCRRGLPLPCFEYEVDVASGEVTGGIPFEAPENRSRNELQVENDFASIPYRPVVGPFLLNLGIHGLGWWMLYATLRLLRCRIDLDRLRGWFHLAIVSALGGVACTVLAPFLTKVFVHDLYGAGSGEKAPTRGDVLLDDLQLRWKVAKWDWFGGMRLGSLWYPDDDWYDPTDTDSATIVPAWAQYLVPIGESDQKTNRLVVARGWPMLAFWGGCEIDFEQHVVVSKVGAIVRLPASPRLDKNPLYADVIPYAPVWRGLIVNTVFYSLVVFALLAHVVSPRIASRIRRRMKGRCIDCGYDVRQSFLECPECGRNLIRALEL